MYIYNPDISEEENFKNLLIESGYLEEHLPNIEITKYNTPLDKSLSTLDVSYKGIVARGFGTNKGNHEYERVLPLIKKEDFITEKQIEPFKEHTAAERKNIILSALKNEAQFKNNNQLEKYEFVEIPRKETIGLLDYEVNLKQSDRCVFGTQKASVYLVKDYKKTDLEKSLELPGFWLISTYGNKPIETLSDLKNKRNWILYSTRSDMVIYNKEYHKTIIGFYDAREDSEKEYVDATKTLIKNRFDLEYRINETKVIKEIKGDDGKPHEYGNEFAECICEIKDPDKKLGIRGEIVSYIWIVDLEFIFKKHIENQTVDNKYKYDKDSIEKTFKTILKTSVENLPKKVEAENFRYLFECEIDTDEYDAVKNKEKAKYLAFDVVKKSRGLYLDLELLFEEDKFEHVFYYKLKNTTALREGIQITKGDVFLKIIVKDNKLPIFPTPKNQLSGYEMI